MIASGRSAFPNVFYGFRPLYFGMGIRGIHAENRRFKPLLYKDTLIVHQLHFFQKLHESIKKGIRRKFFDRECRVE